MPPRSLAETYESIPELMRVARGSYKRAIDAELASRGIDDVPNPGGFMLCYLAGGQESVAELIDGLGIRKREFNEFVDKLVLRGFIERATEPHTGAVRFALTERGREAADAIFAGGRVVDDELARRLSETEMAGLRTGLLALGEIKLSLPDPYDAR
jgi:DNA-binding MarR family transcriptional regulator